MSTRESFVERFGEEDAARMEAAAEGHKNGVHDSPGSDPFRWAIAVCIGYQCFEVDRYRKCHGFKASFEDIKN